MRQELPKLMTTPSNDDRMLMLYVIQEHTTKADIDYPKRVCTNRNPCWKNFDLRWMRPRKKGN